MPGKRKYKRSEEEIEKGHAVVEKLSLGCWNACLLNEEAGQIHRNKQTSS